MSHAILRVTYKNDKGPAKYHEVDSENALNTKLAEERSKPEVQQIEVHLHHRFYTRVEQWVETAYKADNPQSVSPTKEAV